MQILYNLVIRFYYFAILTAAFFGNEKAKLWIDGRKQWYLKLERALYGFKDKERFWFHCASLGEFEQGRALIEKVRKEFPNAFILLTFFSPSGYEVRKKYTEVDHVSYLPLDTKKNARRLIQLLDPSKTIFIKYEFWFHYITELSKKNKPIYIASAIFRPQQIFFKWYGSFFRTLLKKITHIFLQDKNSQHLLSEKGIINCSVSGDTRFDRVYKIAKDAKPVLPIENFVDGNKTIVAGSTWPADEDALLKIFHALEEPGLKLILVPHEVNPQRIKQLKDKIDSDVNFKGATLYSDKSVNKEATIMIVDTIGILSSVYKYASVTWVGGGFNNGIHNILEPAAHGKPIFFGPVYQKFREAHELISCQSAFSVNDLTDARRTIKKLLSNNTLLSETGKSSSDYVKKNLGATDKIFQFVFNKPTEKKSSGTQQTIEY